ncbi:hypothetical protein B0H13DRAFT_1929653 [Mycena leptocephala]|nr:hypothetical protein B0H13DRAFT_1929653 [Mycena leptocephala]
MFAPCDNFRCRFADQFLATSMVGSMKKKGLSAIAINSETLTAAALVSLTRDLWTEAKTGVHRLIFIGPEMMKTRDYQAFITDKAVRLRLGQFTVDELHVADEWGIEYSDHACRLPEHTTFVGLSASIEPGRQFEACVKLMGFNQLEYHLEKQDFPPGIMKALDFPKLLIFVQAIDAGHRVVAYLRGLLPPHLRKDGYRLIRRHHSLACPDCKAEGLDSLYKCDEDRDCLIHVSTDVLTVGVDISGLAAVVLYGKISSVSALVQCAGHAYIYVTKSDMAEALAYMQSDAGKQDRRVLEDKDPNSHVHVPVALSPDSSETTDTSAMAPAQSAPENAPENIPPGDTTSSAKKSKKAKKGKFEGLAAKPGQRTCSSLLLVFAAHARDRCITRQLNIIYGNPGVQKDCGRCSSCVGDNVPEPRTIPASIPADQLDTVDPEAEKMPTYMKPQLKDLKTIVEKLEKSAYIISLITADFLSIASAEVFKHRVRCWEYADNYGLALWNVVKVLVDDLRKELLTRHDDALEKQRGARLHKSLVAAGIDHITRVQLILPREPGTQAAAVEHTDNTAAGVAPEHGNDLTTVVAPEDFYAGSPKKSLPKGRKRKAQESADTAESSKWRKKANKENLGPARVWAQAILCEPKPLTQKKKSTAGKKKS